MISSEWNKVEFEQFVNDYGIEPVIKLAPVMLYSKKDKEHEAHKSLIASFFVAGGLLIYIALSFLLMGGNVNLIVLISVVVISGVLEGLLILNYFKSNVYIKPIECWVEIYNRDNSDFYCFTYHPVFSGKCHPNKAKDIIYKLYLKEVLKSKIDITQIEIYFKLSSDKKKKLENLGYFFQYGEGEPFTNENINQNAWRFFPSERSKNDNFISIANWNHQYEWRDDLTLDFDKLHDYAPWIIRRWNKDNLKPLSEEYKDLINWELRPIESLPKLKPWEGDLQKQSYEDQTSNLDIKIINDAIKNVMGEDADIKKLKDLQGELFKFKAYFRDFTS